MYDGFKVIGLHDQDYIHKGKKIVNPLFSGRRDLIVGKELISFNHVRMVYNNFKVDVDHKLKIEDIERIDRQNWGSAQCIASRHVQRCLKEMRCTSGRTERTSGTETYIAIVADYIDTFLSPSLNIWERVRNSSRVHHFFTLWLCWVREQENTNVNINFISREP